MKKLFLQPNTLHYIYWCNVWWCKIRTVCAF